MLSRKQIGWQVFEALGTVPHEMRSGRDISLVQYRACCATCGQEFDSVAAQRAWKAKNLARRCAAHRVPGSHVNNLVPPVPVDCLPAWARPNREAVVRSLGSRQPACPYFPSDKPPRLIEPARYETMVLHADIRAYGVDRALKFADQRARERKRLGLEPANRPLPSTLRAAYRAAADRMAKAKARAARQAHAAQPPKATIDWSFLE